ncbi:hypothetical protein KSP40_PGU017407 [Platanthera guangdongensis]|uniref:Uncharacterized protein n=1 Tax=Platanthera guangdongensis TaxID=2320717 RepID=A0ABR2MGF2_9ASPA
MQVFDFAAFPEPTLDYPIFCANFFTTSTLSIVVLDLNPLHDVTLQRDYIEKYYRSLMLLYQKYAEFFPWGDKITSESLKFFSPIVIWSKYSSSLEKHETLYAAFKDYFKAWLVVMEQAVEVTDKFQTVRNTEAQHKYLTWRAEKDPGHPLLKRLMGENLAREMVRRFLFEGVDSLGTKSFLDYFPEYLCEDGSVNRKRSIAGKGYRTRPWDAEGNFIGHAILFLSLSHASSTANILQDESTVRPHSVLTSDDTVPGDRAIPPQMWRFQVIPPPGW